MCLSRVVVRGDFFANLSKLTIFYFYYVSFIGCPTCDNLSGRRQVDLCGLGKKQTLTDPKYWSVNRDAVPGSPNDIYKHNPVRRITRIESVDKLDLKLSL